MDPVKKELIESFILAATIILCFGIFMGGCVVGCKNGAFDESGRTKFVREGYSQRAVTVTNITTEIIWVKP